MSEAKQNITYSRASLISALDSGKEPLHLSRYPQDAIQYSALAGILLVRSGCVCVCVMKAVEEARYNYSPTWYQRWDENSMALDIIVDIFFLVASTHGLLKWLMLQLPFSAHFHYGNFHSEHFRCTCTPPTPHLWILKVMYYLLCVALWGKN